MSDLTIELRPSTSPRSAEERAGLLQDPGFGQVFTDHMVAARYAPDLGWHDARLTAYAPLTLDPATSALHYGQAIFEGLKAYHQPDGSVALFRPEQNARRFQRSARRLAMAEVPEQLFLDAITRPGPGGPRLGAGRTRARRSTCGRWSSRSTRSSASGRPASTSSCCSPRRPAPTSRAACSRSRCGCPPSTPGPLPAAPARRSAPATTRRPSWRRRRPPSRAATRSSGSTRWSTATSRRWAA